MSTPSLSVCLIVKNEARYLERCLASVHGVADELIVVDTGSTDDTLAIAERHQARIFHFAWRNDFALARNYSLAQARSEWILMLDGDEELDADSRRQLKPWLARAEADAYELTIHSYYPPDALTQYGDTPIVRLFRNRAEFRYEQPIHEQIIPAIVRAGGLIQPAAISIWHHGYAEKREAANDRDQRNIALLQTASAAAPDNPFLHAMLGINLGRVGQLETAQQHLLDALRPGAAPLPADVLQKVYASLGGIAYAREDYPAAVDYARQSLACPAPDGLQAMRLRAQACLKIGEQAIKNRLQPALADPQPDLAAIGRSAGEARAAIQQSLQAVRQIQQSERFNPARQADLEAQAGQCERLLAALARLPGAA